MDLQIKTIGEAVSRYKNSQKTAVICEGRRLSYESLWHFGVSVAQNLISRGLKKGDRVVLDMGRSEHYPCMLLGICLSGGIAVYIHRGWPPKQKDYVIRDCDPGFIVNDKLAAELMAPLPGVSDAEAQRRLPQLDGSDAFQIVYTSGSTGSPKGTVLCHLVVSNISHPFEKNGEFRAVLKNCETILMDSDFSFVASTITLMWAWFGGITMVIAGDEELSSIGRLAELICREDAAMVNWTPSRIVRLLPDPLMADAVRRIRVMAVMGEKITEQMTEIVNRYMPDAQVFCAYGMSELMHLTDHLLQSGNENLIDGACENIGLHVLDDQGNEVPEGETGELCVSGIPAVLGKYWRNPVLTENKYTMHPVLGRIFHTGDLAVREKNGGMRIAGRSDQMTKLRGLRIDLQAIERTILAYSGIREAVALVEGEGDKQALAAFYTRTVNGSPESADRLMMNLRRYLSDELPYYMIPVYLMELPEIPLNYNGKADRKALSLLKMAEPAFRASETGMEKLLCELYTEILELSSPAGADDSFFMLGGDSVAGMELAASLEKRGIHMELKWLYCAPTPLLLSAYLSEKADKAEEGDDGNLPPLPEWTAAQRLAVRKAGYEELIECIYPVSEGIIMRLHDREPWMLADYWLTDFDESALMTIRSRLEEMTKAHQSLRSVFLFPEGERPVQAVLKKSTADFFFEDLSEEAEGEAVISPRQKRYLGRRIRYDLARGTDLTKGPLFTVGLIRIRKDQAVLYRFYSHVLFDGQSLLILRDELTGSREAIEDRQQMDVHFRQLLDAGADGKDVYWKKMQLPQRPIALTAPEREKAELQSTLRSFSIGDRELLKGIQDFCRSNGIGIASVLHYCLGRALCLLLHCRSVCFLSLTGGRNRTETELIGSFIHTFPFIFNEEDTVWDCQEQLIAAEKRSSFWALGERDWFRLHEKNTLVLDVIHVHGENNEENAALMPLHEALDEIGLKAYFHNMQRIRGSEDSFMIMSSPGLQKLYFCTYDASRVDEVFAKELRDRLLSELREAPFFPSSPPVTIQQRGMHGMPDPGC